MSTPMKGLPMNDTPLKEKDLEVYNILKKERHRQWSGIELIASENFTSKAVLECLGSCLTNKYSEGYPKARYYGGNEFIDEVELLCQKRALEAFSLDPAKWGVNVQPYSGSPANFAAISSVVPPGGKIMGLDLPSGGHLTHGYQTPKKKISATSLFWESQPYTLNDKGFIDYDKLASQILEFKPNLLICGHSAYPRDLDYKRFREIADSVGAYLMSDIAHISGLIAAEEHANPFLHSHIVTSTTHKSLRGPRSGLIFYTKDPASLSQIKSKAQESLEESINASIFPRLQGGPHNHQIAGVCTQLKEVNSLEFKEYIKQVKKNAITLAEGIMDKGGKLLTNGTENHLILWDLKPQALTGSKFEKICDHVHITMNKNSILGDQSAMTPGGVRIGTCAMTSRGCNQDHMKTIAHFLHQVLIIAQQIQEKTGKKIGPFVQAFSANQDLDILRKNVSDFSKSFDIPGFDTQDLHDL